VRGCRGSHCEQARMALYCLSPTGAMGDHVVHILQVETEHRNACEMHRRGHGGGDGGTGALPAHYGPLPTDDGASIHHPPTSGNVVMNLSERRLWHLLNMPSTMAPHPLTTVHRPPTPAYHAPTRSQRRTTTACHIAYHPRQSPTDHGASMHHPPTSENQSACIPCR
jgi:hypothetical protein